MLVMGKGGGGASQTYVDDVFSTYLYTGDGVNTGKSIPSFAPVGTSAYSIWSPTRSTNSIYPKITKDSSGNIYTLSGYNSSVTLTKFQSDGTITWQKNLNISGSETDKGFYVDSNGNSYVSAAGTISKYDSNGTLSWARTVLNPSGGSTAACGGVDSSGNSYFVQQDNPGSFYVARLYKYDSAGTLSFWRFFYDSASSSITVRDAYTDSSGNTYICGDTDVTAIGYKQGFIVKYSNTGSMLWSKKVQFSTSSNTTCTVITSDGTNLFVAGLRGYITGNQVCYVGKFLCSTGAEQAIYTLNNQNGDNNSSYFHGLRINSLDTALSVTAITLDSSNNIYVAGKGNYSISNTSGSYVIKLNASGVVQWSNGFSSQYNSGVNSIAWSNNSVYLPIHFLANTTERIFKMPDTGNCFGNAAVGQAGSTIYGFDIFAVSTATGGVTSDISFSTSSGTADGGTASITVTAGSTTNTITNVSAIPASNSDCLVWIKDRTNTNTSHILSTYSSKTGTYLSSDSTNAYYGNPNTILYNSTGAILGSSATTNNAKFVMWNFKKAAKFFDIVTWTGNGGTSGRTITHALGATPALIIAKKTSGTAQDWYVYHRSLAGGTNPYFLILNSTAAQDTGGGIWGDPAGWTGTTFTTRSGTSALNTNAETYVAYLFAHDTASDGLIQCGSFTTNASGDASVTLGWEPQYFLLKQTSGTGGGWFIIDTMRGFTATSGVATSCLYTNTTAAEDSGTYRLSPTSTGAKELGSLSTSATYIYLAIRRPNKPPTSGTQVYEPVAYSGDLTSNRIVGSLLSDMFFIKRRDRSDLGYLWQDRLRGPGVALATGAWGSFTSGTDIERSFTGLASDGFAVMSGVKLSSAGGYNENPGPAGTYTLNLLKRAPGVFDQICYTGTGANKTEAHNLGVAPELWLVKVRGVNTGAWAWGSATVGANKYTQMPSAGSGWETDTTAWNNTLPTATALSLGTLPRTNNSGNTFVAYLFATLAGVSKVGSYTGNGTSQTINCGFSAGARFVLIIRTDGVAINFFVWDTARGIVAANDPYLNLGTTAAEVTTDDSIDPDSTGFIVNQVAATNINVNAATYIYLAFA